MASLQTAPFPLEAARTGRYQAIAEWQQSGGHLDAPFRFEDWSPLQLLCAEGNRDGVRALCECGALAEPALVIQHRSTHRAGHGAGP